MMKLRNMKLRTKVISGVAAGAMLIAGGGMAFAYFTSTGSGTGSATVGISTAWTVGESSSILPTGGPLYPDHAIGGANIQTVTYTVTNPSAGSQNLTQVVISVAKADGTAWSSQTNLLDPPCTAADFSVGGQPVGTPWTDSTLAGDFIAGVSQSSPVTIELIDNNKVQDNCQGLTVPLYFAAS